MGTERHCSRDGQSAVSVEVDQLADTIAVSSARIDAATHELLTQIRRFDELKGWAWQGAKSCTVWLSWRVGLGLGAAGEKVRVAKALGELPRIDASFAAGELSYCKVRAMTRVATADNEELLLTMAKSATGAQLESVCRGFRRVQRAAAADAEGRRHIAGPDRYVRRRPMQDGMVRIEMQLLPDEAELVWQALEQVRGELCADMKGSCDTVQSDAALSAGSDDRDAAEAAAVAQAPVVTDAAAAAMPARPSTEKAEAAAEAEPAQVGQRVSSDSAESLIGLNEPLAHLFAPEPEEPRGRWDRCEETGELVYYGSDPPDVWPEDGAPCAENTAAEDIATAAGLPAEPAESFEGAPRLADAMVMLAERRLSEGSQGADGRLRRGGERQLLLVHLSEDRLAHALGAPAQHGALPASASDDSVQRTAAVSGRECVPFCAELHGGGRLDGDTLLRLACDCGITVVKTGNADDDAAAGGSTVLDVGRVRRTIPPALMRALLVRDGGCRFPGCCSEAWIEAHHVDHWAHGGETSLDNTLLLCRFHHVAVHEGGFRISRAQDGSLRFHDPAGRILEPAPAPALDACCHVQSGSGVLASLAAEQRQRDVSIDRTTSLPAWNGTTPDIGAAVSALWWRDERLKQRRVAQSTSAREGTAR